MGDRSETETLKAIRVLSITNFFTARQYPRKNFINTKNGGKCPNGVGRGHTLQWEDHSVVPLR